MRIIITFFFLIISLYAENIDKYDMNVHILNNGNIDVVENILYNFSPNQKHGIFRNIPMNKNIIDIISVKQDNKKAKYSTSFENDDIVIKIGDKNILVTGRHLYTIHYIIKRAVFKKNDNFNAISLNAIGSQWKISISNINIHINLPPKLATSKFMVYKGERGSVHKINYKQISSTNYLIHIPYLSPHEGITFDVIFDKNLIKVYKPYTKWIYIYLILSIILIYLYYSKHKIPYIAKSPQYYPPKNLSILKSGLLIDEIADIKDISTAILELAVKGYLKIEQKDKDVILIQLKEDSAGLDTDEKMLFEILFIDNNQIVLNQLTDEDKIRISSVINSINNWLYDWSVEKGYFFQTLSDLKIKFLSIVGITLLPFVGFAFYQNFEFNFSMIFTHLFVLLIVFVGIYQIINDKKILSKIFWIITIIAAGYMFFIDGIGYKYIILVSLIPFLFAFYLSNKLNVYTFKGLKQLKYLLGLKEFVLRVEKDKIERLLQDNPNYLDEILPYAVLFGANHWFELYDEFNVDRNWYIGNKVVFYELGRKLYDDFSVIENVNSDDSFSGGGSVGSGSGGGGGGSW